MSMSKHDNNTNSTILKIVDRHQRIYTFWSDCRGWAPEEVVDLLSRVRLDWQVALSKTLHIYCEPCSCVEGDARLILGYANLGALVEGALKLFLTVYYEDYLKDGNKVVDRKGNIIDPDAIRFEDLRQFFVKVIWDKGSRYDWDPWIHKIQSRRNAIHAFKDRDLGVVRELFEDIDRYLEFLECIDDSLPYP